MEQRIDTARLGLSLNRYGSVGLHFQHRKSSGLPTNTSLGGSYRISLGFSSLIINFSQTLAPESASVVSASLVVPFSQDYVAIVGVSRQNDKLSELLEFQKNRNNTDLGNSYRLRAATDHVRHRFEAGMRSQTRYNRFSISGQSNDGVNSLRAGIDSSIAWVGDELFFSRPIERSFAVVETGGIADLSIYSENRFAGKTDVAGQLLIPDLNPYTSNRLRLDPVAIPFDATVEQEKIRIAPYFRSGAVVQFPIIRSLSVTATIVDSRGKALPAGTLLSARNGSGMGRVASAGRAYIEKLSVGNIQFNADTGMGDCSFSITMSDEMGLLPDLGHIICR